MLFYYYLISQISEYLKRGKRMNILFFLTPKSEVAFIFDNDSLRQALEKMEGCKYSAVPVLNRKGKYIGSITEGDMLWGIKNQYNLSLKNAEKIRVASIPRRMDYQPVHVDATMEDLIEKALNQNFVPVVDDQKNFIGIIRRRDIIRYCYTRLMSQSPEPRTERETDDGIWKVIAVRQGMTGANPLAAEEAAAASELEA